MANKSLDAAMENTLAYRLGQIAHKTMDESEAAAGDFIDMGLILCRLLDEGGFSLVLKEEGHGDKAAS